MEDDSMPFKCLSANLEDNILVHCFSQSLISGGKEHQIEEHLAPGRRAIHAKRPKSASAIRHRMARTYMIRRNISCYKNAGKGVDPKKKRRDAYSRLC